uniref:N-terminal methionine N(alpha)-acetyltransferase NatC n=1 Tax=Lygus hesperus TaxID=30085 RepID=A0A0A9W870_LYGHE
MEKTEEKKLENHLPSVEVTKTCINDKTNEIQHSLEDSNRNITIIPSKDELILNKKDLIQNCETNLRGLSLKSPNGLCNGVDSGNSESKDLSYCSSVNCGVTDSSSHCGRAKGNEGSAAVCVVSPQDCAGSAEGIGNTTALACESGPSIQDGRPTSVDPTDEVQYVSYVSELQMPDIMSLIQKDLSEPYSIYTYRYFIHNWPQLCFLAMVGKACVGAIVCKLDMHRKVVKRGYIAMLAVDEKYRKRKIGSNLVLKAIRAMVADGADEVVLETEITNKPALRLYENLGFVRDKRLFRYYLNGVDALRLKLWLR